MIYGVGFGVELNYGKWSSSNSLGIWAQDEAVGLTASRFSASGLGLRVSGFSVVGIRSRVTGIRLVWIWACLV